MKISFASALLISLLSLSSFANTAVPRVICELIYTEQDENGVTMDFDRGEPVSVSPEGMSYTKNGFTMTLQLLPIRAAGNQATPTIGYDLLVLLQNGNSSATSLYNVQTNQRSSLVLNVQNKLA